MIILVNYVYSLVIICFHTHLATVNGKLLKDMDVQEEKLVEMIQNLGAEMDTIIEKADPLLSYLKQKIADYSSKRKFAQIVIQGSVGNNLYFPEILQDGVYRVEVDMLFEQDSANLITLPVWNAEEMEGLPQIKVDVIQDEGANSPQYVNLKVTQLPEYLTDGDMEEFLEFNDVKKEYYLKNSAYLNSLPSVQDEIQGGIMGEKEISTTVFSNDKGKRPFRPFQTGKHHFLRDKETIDFKVLMDKVAAIKVKWPEFASSWGDRERRWPPDEVCREIIQNGIHVIPKSKHKSQSETQWKYTFAIAEQTLAHTFMPIQKFCYLILKQLKRKYMSRVSIANGSVILQSGISTHHLKTIMFWTSEKLDPMEWEADPARCLRLLIETFADFLLHNHCPSYFVPEVNLFERLWMDESKFLYVKSEDQLRDLRIQAVLELVVKVQENLDDYLTMELLQIVDEDHDIAESNAKFAQDGLFSSSKYDLAKVSISLDELTIDPAFRFDYRQLCRNELEEKEEQGVEEEEYIESEKEDKEQQKENADMKEDRVEHRRKEEF